MTVLYIHKRTLYADTRAELLQACRRLRVHAWRMDPGLVPKATLTPRQALTAPGLLDARFEGLGIERRLANRIRRELEPRWWKYAHAVAAIFTLFILTNLPAWGMWP